MGRPRSFDEDTVVAAARDRFWDAGYAATSLNDLAAATGLGKTSLYGAFGDKRALYMRIFDEYCAGAIRAVQQALAGPDEGAFERIREHLLANARASAGDRQGCLLARGTAELAGHDADVAARARQAFQELGGVYSSAVEAAQRAGEIAPEADARVMGGVVLAIHRGTEALGRGGADETTLRAIVEGALVVLRPTAVAE
jgi:AcrR family transcriptional regulator